MKQSSSFLEVRAEVDRMLKDGRYTPIAISRYICDARREEGITKEEYDALNKHLIETYPLYYEHSFR